MLAMVRAESSRLLAVIHDGDEMSPRIEVRHLTPPAVILDLIVLVVVLLNKRRLHAQLLVQLVWRHDRAFLYPHLVPSIDERLYLLVGSLDAWSSHGVIVRISTDHDREQRQQHDQAG